MSETFTRVELADELMSSGDLADYCGVSRQTISNWKKRGLPMPPTLAQVAGGATDIYLRRDVDAWRDEHLVEVKTVRVFRLKKDDEQ